MFTTKFGIWEEIKNLQIIEKLNLTSWHKLVINDKK